MNAKVINLAAEAEERKIDALIRDNPLCIDLNYIARDPQFTAVILGRLEPKFAVAVMEGRMQPQSADLVLGFLRYALQFHHRKDRQRFRYAKRWRKMKSELAHQQQLASLNSTGRLTRL